MIRFDDSTKRYARATTVGGLTPSVRMSPVAVHRYFAGLGGAERAALAARYPAVVGRLDGAPPALRYAANRRQMRAARYGARAGQYLLFDPRGAGRVALVYGDLCTADRIGVLVPGADNGAANFGCGLGGRSHRAPTVQAGNLYRAARAVPGAPRVAVVAWLGYRTPRGLGIAAAREDLAAAGAAELVRFVDGLAVVCPQSTIAVLGHSYGSVVVGLAARRMPSQVRDIAAFGSPGMGVARAAHLGTRATIWAARSRNDWIRWVPGVRVLGLGHGRHPSSPAFGARPFSTTGVAGHDHYLAPGTASLADLAGIVAGHR
jgi:hypothetical protein